MKTTELSFAVFAALTLASQAQTATNASHTDPFRPTGSLDVNRDTISVGLSPQLSWNIKYPENSFVINPGNSVSPTKDTCFEVRVLGVAVQSGNKQIPVRIEMNMGSGWSYLFQGTGPQVLPSSVVKSAPVVKDQPINFRFQSYVNAGGNTNKAGDGWRSTSTSTKNVIALKNGDVPPNYVPYGNQANVKAFLSSYIKNGKVAIGPKDVIYLVEAFTTDTRSQYFDMQDAVILVTFDTCVTSTTNSSVASGKSNNGHGNNIDGVDSSNPGNAPFIDSDPNVDDEKKK